MMENTDKGYQVGPTKTYLLGLGAQKAGTTWVQRYINSYPSVDTGTKKEYHIWDASFASECARLMRVFPKKISKSDLIRWKMQIFSETYFDYFEGLLKQNDITLTADITPSYSALAPKTLRKIHDGFQRRGIHVKVVFLMRDPIERCWSAVRMHQRKGDATEGVATDLAEETSLLNYYTTRHATRRTNYHLTVQNVEQIFPAEDVYLGIYEDLFDTASVTAISSFLGLAPNYDFAQEKFNVSAKQTDLTLATKQRIATEFKEVYAYCADRFPQTKALWQGYDLI